MGTRRKASRSNSGFTIPCSSAKRRRCCRYCHVPIPAMKSRLEERKVCLRRLKLPEQFSPRRRASRLSSAASTANKIWRIIKGLTGAQRGQRKGKRVENGRETSLPNESEPTDI